MPGKAKAKCLQTGVDYAVYAALAEGLGAARKPQKNLGEGSKFSYRMSPQQTATRRAIGESGVSVRSSKPHRVMRQHLIFKEKREVHALWIPSLLMRSPTESSQKKRRGEEAFKKTGWDQFYKQYPEAAAIGYSRSR
jgi:hypothetical protein